MRKVLVLALALVMLAGVSAAGNVSRGFEKYVGSMQGSDEITVLVVLQDQVDVAALDWQLHNAKSSMEDRHAIVVGSLQDVSKRSQGRLLADLAASKALGEVKGYTSHWLVNSVVVRTTVDGARALALRDDVEIVEPNLEIELIEPASGPVSKGFDKDTNGIGICPGVVAVGARRVWSELGINGTGAVVGVLDTGVDGTHPALSARWRGNFAPAAECWLDAANLGDPSFPVDRHYHGTHVMGTITGLAADDSIGVAPGAQWIATNIINSSTGAAFDNGVIASLEFMADPDGNPLTLGDVPDVVQNSWGVNENFTGYVDCDSRWWAAIDNCEASGVVLTWSAGNEGPGSTTLRSPGDRAASPYNCFSVGSTIDTPPYTISSFSSRGPSGCGGAYAMKPEICAPGDNVYSAEPGGGYQYLGGTSMAGPHIAGVVALMRAANPGLDVITIKQILMDTANDLGTVGEDNTYGHGFVDAYEAVLAVMQGYGTAEGVVTNSVTGDPVAGALVEVVGTPRAANTNALGFYSMMMEQGSYTFDYSAFGYLPGSQPVTVVEDVTTTADFVLTPAPSAMIYGYVFDDSAAPVAGATVRALGTPVTPATTDGTGYYELTLPVGTTYNVLAQAYGMGSAQVAIALTADVQQDFTLPALIFENFESGGLAVFPWETSGDADWFVTTTDAYEGTHSVRSGDINDSESSVLEVTVDVLAAGNIEFYYRVESEASYDYLHFAIDGAEQGSWSGTVPWTLGSFAVGRLAHVHLDVRQGQLGQHRRRLRLRRLRRLPDDHAPGLPVGGLVAGQPDPGPEPAGDRPAGHHAGQQRRRRADLDRRGDHGSGRHRRGRAARGHRPAQGRRRHPRGFVAAAGLRRPRRLRLHLDRQRRLRRPGLQLGRDQRRRHGPDRRRRHHVLAAEPGLQLQLLRDRLLGRPGLLERLAVVLLDGDDVHQLRHPEHGRAQQHDRPVLGRPELADRRHGVLLRRRRQPAVHRGVGRGRALRLLGCRDLPGHPERRQHHRLPVQDDDRHAQRGDHRHRERHRYRRPADRVQRALRAQQPGGSVQLRAAAGPLAVDRSRERRPARPHRRRGDHGHLRRDRPSRRRLHRQRGDLHQRSGSLPDRGAGDPDGHEFGRHREPGR
ncbi:MAG: S8 family serine peptidase [bacterium]|nr:S8 family serine peptidase [bacterium]